MREHILETQAEGKVTKAKKKRGRDEGRETAKAAEVLPEEEMAKVKEKCRTIAKKEGESYDDLPPLGGSDTYDTDDELAPKCETSNDSSSEEDKECYVGRNREKLNSRYEDSCNEHFRASRTGEERLMSENVGKELWVSSAIDDNPMDAEDSELP